MAPRPEGHHCASCNKSVLDMSSLTSEEAVHTVRTAPSTTCVSYAFAEDGRLVFRAARRAGGTVLLGVAAFLSACGSPDGAASSPDEPPRSAGEHEPNEIPRPRSGPAEAPEAPVAEPHEGRLGLSPPHTPFVPPYEQIPSWPSAVTNSVPPNAHAVIVRSAAPKLQGPQKAPLRTSGKPVIHRAGGLSAPVEDEML